MELADHLRHAGKWSWLLVILPVVSALVAFAAIPREAAPWTGTATVLTSPSVTGRNGIQYINDFQAALRSDSVTAEVARRTGVSADEAREGLSSQPMGPGSSLVQVAFTSTDRDAAAAVPRVAAQLALQLLIQPQIDALDAQLEIAREQYAAALRAREQYTGQIGVLLPGQAYQSGLAELSSLRNNYQMARLEGRDSAAGLLQQLETRSVEVEALAPQAVQYTLLQNDVERTYNELNRLRFSLAAVRAQLDATEAASTVTPGDVFVQSTSPQRFRPVITAAVVGLVVAAGVVAAVLALSAQTSRTRRRVDLRRARATTETEPAHAPQVAAVTTEHTTEEGREPRGASGPAHPGAAQGRDRHGNDARDEAVVDPAAVRPVRAAVVGGRDGRA